MDAETNITPLEQSGIVPRRPMERFAAWLKRKHPPIITPPATENDGGIHPDIDAGMATIISAEIPSSIKRGGVDIRPALSNLQAGMNQADIVEVPEETQEQIINQVCEAVDTNLQEGLRAQLKSVESYVSNGHSLASIRQEIEGVRQILELAKKRNIKLAFTPEAQAGTGAEGEAPARILQTEAEILAYVEDTVDRCLFAGLEAKFRFLKHDVSTGFFYDSLKFDEDLEEWLAFMQERGIEVINEPIPISVSAVPDENALIRRQVSRSQLRQLKETTVRENLAAGVQKIIDMTAYNFRTGFGDPLAWITDHFEDYKAEGLKFGVVNHNLKTLVEGGEFNPDLLKAELIRVIKENIQEGLSAIIATHLSWVEDGTFRSVDSQEQLLQEYIRVAKEFRVPIDAKALKNKIRENINPQTVQKGIEAILAYIKSYIREGSFNLARVGMINLEQAEQFVKKHKLQRQVDLSKLREYLDEVGLSRPQLPE